MDEQVFPLLRTSLPDMELLFDYRFNLLYTAVTFHHFFTVSLLAQNLPFQRKYYLPP